MYILVILSFSCQLLSLSVCITADSLKTGIFIFRSVPNLTASEYEATLRKIYTVSTIEVYLMQVT